jgi:hypothetical protein
MKLAIAALVAVFVAGCAPTNQQAGYNPAMADMGMRLMAAGQRMTPQQRAATLSGMAVMPPTYVAPAPTMRTTNCSALGSTLNCTSY